MEKIRYDYIDMAKGLAITIVVASHVLQFNTHDYQQSIFFN